MTKTLYKVFWAWQAEEEEQWLRDMAAQGWALKNVGFCRYTFEQCQPNEYVTRLEYLYHLPSHPDSVKYIKFIEESGAEYVGHFSKWVYFRKKVEKDEDFELFSDNSSRIKYMERVTGLLSGLAIMNFIIGILNILMAFGGSSVNGLGIINLVLAVFLYCGYRKMNDKCQKLVEERYLFDK